MDFLTRFALVGAAVMFSAWVVLANRRRIACAADALSKISRARIAAFLVFAAIATVCAQKPGGTNDPPQGAGSPLHLLHFYTANPPAPLFRLELESTNETYSYAMPTNGVRYSNWWMHGAYEDVFRHDLGGLLFPFGTNLCDSLWVYTWGMVGARLDDASNRLVAAGVPMSAVPQLSQFWSAETDGGGRLLTWQDFALDRDTNTPVSAQLELMPSGDFIARSNLVERLYRRVNPDDWDDDGTPNEEDDDPLAYDGDNFGPHQTLPEGANTNHYYWVDVVVSQANARVTFEGDGYSHLPDPEFIARAGDTNRVVLLLGKPYEIHCNMPVRIVGKEGVEVEVLETDGNLGVVWPVSLEFVPLAPMRSSGLRSHGASGGTTIAVHPERAGGGVLDGSGGAFWKRLVWRAQWHPGTENKDEQRPRLLYVADSRDVRVEGVVLRNAAFWTTHFHRCDGVTLDGLRIFTETFDGVGGQNPDAVDLDGASRVRIRNVRMDVPNDAVTIKGGKGPDAHDPAKSPDSAAVRDVLIENCTFGPQCTGCLTLGSECFSASNIVMRSCHVEGPVCVLRLKMRPDTLQRYQDVHVSGMDGQCDYAMIVKPYTAHARPEWKGIRLESLARDVSFDVGTLRCVKGRSVIQPNSEYKLENVTCR